MPRDTLEVRSGDLSLLVGHELNSTVPLASVKSSFDGFVHDASLHKVLNREVKLFLGGKPVTPLLLKGHNVRGESSLRKLNSLAESVTLHIRVKSAVKHVHLLVEITSLFMHARLNKLRGDLVELVVRDLLAVGRDTVGSLCGQTALQIKLDSRDVVSFAFFDLGSLCLLVGLEEPLEVVVLELADVLVLEFFSDLDGFVPAVKLLVHRHSLFDFIMLNKNSLSLVELLIKNGKLRLNAEVVNAFSGDQLVQLAKVLGPGHVS